MKKHLFGYLAMFVLLLSSCGSGESSQSSPSRTDVPNTPTESVSQSIPVTSQEVEKEEPPAQEPVIEEPVIEEPVIEEPVTQAQTLSVETDSELALFAEEWSSLWNNLYVNYAGTATLTAVLKKEDNVMTRGALALVLENQLSILAKMKALNPPAGFSTVYQPFVAQCTAAENECKDFELMLANPFDNFENTLTYGQLLFQLYSYLDSIWTLQQNRSAVDEYLYAQIPKEELGNSSSLFNDFLSSFNSNDSSSSFDIEMMNQYFLPDASTVLLTGSDLEYFTANELRLARNEIYARHGRTFLDESLMEWFNAQEWYQNTYPKYAPADFDRLNPSPLNNIEIKNLELIVEYEGRFR